MPTAEIRETVADMLERRGRCRYGLGGLKAEYRGETWEISHSEWGAEDPPGTPRLFLCLLKADSAAAYRADYARLWEEIGGGMGIMPLGLLDAHGDELRRLYPGVEESRIPADQVVLLERWPHTCCRSSRRRRGGK